MAPLLPFVVLIACPVSGVGAGVDVSCRQQLHDDTATIVLEPLCRSALTS
jgi:hypothetical protein